MEEIGYFIGMCIVVIGYRMLEFVLRREKRRLRAALDEKKNEIDELKATIDRQCSQLQALQVLVDIVDKKEI